MLKQVFKKSVAVVHAVCSCGKLSPAVQHMSKAAIYSKSKSDGYTAIGKDMKEKEEDLTGSTFLRDLGAVPNSDEYRQVEDGSGTPGVLDPNLKVLLPTFETHNMLVDGVPYKKLPVAHINCSKNNTIITVTDARGTTILGKASGGTVGFKNAGKRSDAAAQTAGYSVAQAIRREGYTNVKVVVRGLGKGREPSVLGMKLGGINIISITDATIEQSNMKPPKKPRK